MMQDLKVIARCAVVICATFLICSCADGKLGSSALSPEFEAVKPGCESPLPINILTEEIICKVSEPCEQAIELEGGENYYIWDESVTLLPVGLSFKEGVISGVLDDVADTTFQVSVSDSECANMVAVKDIKLSVTLDGAGGQELPKVDPATLDLLPEGDGVQDYMQSTIQSEFITLDPSKVDFSNIVDFRLQYVVDVTGDVKTMKPIFVTCEGAFGTKDGNCRFYYISSVPKTMEATVAGGKLITTTAGEKGFEKVCWGTACITEDILSLDFSKRNYFAIYMHEPMWYPLEKLAEQATFKSVKIQVKSGGAWYSICEAEFEKTIKAERDGDNSLYFTTVAGKGDPYIMCK